MKIVIAIGLPPPVPSQQHDDGCRTELGVSRAKIPTANDNCTHFHAPFAHSLQLSLIMVLVVKISTRIVIKGFGFCRWSFFVTVCTYTFLSGVMVIQTWSCVKILCYQFMTFSMNILDFPGYRCIR